MNRCPHEGALQTYIDREDEPEARAHAMAHLSECDDCRLRWQEMSARSERVQAALDSLGETQGDVAALTPTRRVPVGAWVGLAAAVCLGVFLARNPEWGRSKEAATEVVWRLGPTGDVFTPLDDAQPFEMGMLERVELPVRAPEASPEAPTAWVTAEVIVGDDGQPRAYRLVSQ